MGKLDETIFTVKQVAEALRVRDSTILRMLRANVIPGVQIKDDDWLIPGQIVSRLSNAKAFRKPIKNERKLDEGQDSGCCVPEEQTGPDIQEILTMIAQLLDHEKSTLLTYGQRSRTAPITARRQQTFELRAKGWSYTQIAVELGCSKQEISRLLKRKRGQLSA